ncbi:MAG: tetratricopeptide repeat protein, partial [Bacteroidales bacterium]|nr:tetratricopeptide repeat protein [Bacteroidales bacterium]
MRTTKIITILLFVTLSAAANAQTKESMIRHGNRNFKNGQYSEAEKDYKASLDKKYNDKAQFNLGDAYYQQKNYEEAARSFQSVADRNVPKNLEADAYYNLGNSMMEQQKYAEAFDAFKNCLKNNPKDEDARYNLEYARQKMIMQQQQQQQQQ